MVIPLFCIRLSARFGASSNDELIFVVLALTNSERIVASLSKIGFNCETTTSDA